MGSFSDEMEIKVLEHGFKIGAWGQPTHLYVGLAKSTIADTHTGGTIPSEVSGGAYARVQCDTWHRSGATVSNNMAVTFAQATAAWGTVTDWFVVDHASTGTVYAYGKLTSAKNIATNDQAKFATDDIDIGLT